MKLKITDLQNTELLKKIVSEVKVQSSPQIDFVEVESSDSKRDIFGIDELVYNPVTGENGSVGFGYDRGRKVKGITWGGHDTHLHVGFTNKKVAMELIEKARELGLYVGQNVYNKASRNVVTKCHVDDSFHYKLFPGEPLVSAGADISGKKSKMEELIVWAINKYANEKVEVEKYKSDDSVIKKERTDERKVLSGMKKFYKKNTILRYNELKANEFNQDIWDLQFALQFLGFYPDKIDGKFTPLTRKAIAKFQKSIGNKGTGNYKSNEIKPLFLKLKENSFIKKGHTPKIGTNDLEQKYEIKEGYDVILISGIEKYEKVSKQVSRLESGGKRVFGIFYNNAITDFPKIIKQNPNAYVVFYSKGCEYANLVLLNDKEGTPLVKDKSKVYIVEPYKKPSESVNAINGGVPIKNVYVGNGESTGQGLFPGANKRPDGYTHVTILSYIGTILK